MKKLMVLLVSVLLCSMMFVGCATTDGKEDAEKDYSEFAFTEVSWTRDAEEDVETIRFGADGSFTYSCSCGNPVNDSDLCEGYSYDDETKTITLDCLEETDEMITEIIVEKCDDAELHLNFGGETRVFTKK